MKTAFRQPDFPFLSADDDCTSCAPFWEEQNMPPKHMVPVLDADDGVIRTENKGIEIIICPHCDGDRILKLKK